MIETAKPLQKAFENKLAVSTHEITRRVSPDTVAHMHRVTRACDHLGTRLGLSEEILEALLLAAILHDMTKTRGKNGNLVNKKGFLTIPETISMNSHPSTAFYDLSRRPDDLGLSEDETAKQAPRIGLIILTHHMNSREEHHRRHPFHLPANYPEKSTVERVARDGRFLITEDHLSDPELNLARKVLSICDVMDFRITGRAYATDCAPLLPTEAAHIVAQQVVIPREVSHTALVSLAEAMTEARIADTVAGALQN